MSEPIGPARRARTIERLAAETFDVVVIGAGIVGSRIGYEAARLGLRTALLDARDFAGGTSSASSKLIHGGLRYLAMYDVSLVREALAERHALLARVAPHLVRRQPFVMPLYRGGPWRPVELRAGLALYTGLAMFREGGGRIIGPTEARSLVPSLRAEGLRGAGAFADAQVNDARLTLATVSAAAHAGATVLNYAPVVAIGPSRASSRVASVRLTTGELVEVRCRAVINATGPWVDEVRRLERPGCEPLIRLSKGVHVTVPLDGTIGAALIVPVDRERVTFAIPWAGVLLLGTTDTPYEGDPRSARADDADVATVLREGAAALPTVVDPARILARFAGVRALPLGRSNTARAPREHVIEVSPAGTISVSGGKLTTHRRIAIDALRHLPPDVLPRRGAIRPDDARLPDTAPAIAAYGARDPRALEPIHPRGPDVWAQAQYAVDEEWAMTVDDIVRRRTTLELRGLATDDVRARLERLLPAQATDRS